MDLASVVAALASVGVRVSGSTPNNNVQGDSSRACPTGLAGPEPSGTLNDPGQHFQARAAACPTAGSAPSSGPGWGCCLGHQPSPLQWPRFHAGQMAGTLPAGGAGYAGVLPAGGSGIISRSESAPAFSCGGSPSPPLSPSALMTSCAASSVGDRGRVLGGAAGSAIVVSLCLRAGVGGGFPVAGVRAMGAAGRGLGSSNAGSAGRRSPVGVGIRCSACRPYSMGDPVARGV